LTPKDRSLSWPTNFNGTRFNEPTTCGSTAGGIYFTDPAYQSAVVQDGQHVYYLSPDRRQVKRVISDLTRQMALSALRVGKRSTWLTTARANLCLHHQRGRQPVGQTPVCSQRLDGMELDKTATCT